jgi:choline kinase
MASMTAVFIMCNGHQSRWDGFGPKQLVEVQGVPILQRTAEQVLARGIYPQVVTHDSEITNFLNKFRIHSVLAPETFSVLESMLAVYSFWQPRNIFLLGDVYFTDEAMTSIFEDRYAELKFYGNNQEMFALRVGPMKLETLRRDLIKVHDTSRGKLWNLFYHVNGWSHRKSNRPPIRESKYIHFIDDLTDDMDKVRFVKRLERRLKEAQNGRD